MNILDILHKIGYDILSFTDGVYKVQFTKDRSDRYNQKIEAGEIGYKYDLFEVFELKVGEVGVNRLGNLFVEFVSVDGEDIIDYYEYRNMRKEDIYE